MANRKPRKKAIAKNLDPVVLAVVERAALSRDADVAERSGVSYLTFRNWRRGVVNPSFLDLQAVANTVGLEIVVKERKGGEA